MCGKDWVTAEWLDFLGALPKQMSTSQMAALDQWGSGFTKSGNSEILFAWLLAAVRNDYEPAWPAVEDFLPAAGPPQVPAAALPGAAGQPQDPRAREASLRTRAPRVSPIR